MFVNHLLRIFFKTTLIASFSLQAESTLKIATWNIEWLTSSPNKNIAASFRSDSDFEKLNQYYSDTSIDVLGFQEVNDINAIKKVVGQDYTIWISDRSTDDNKRHQFHDLNQYTGFAVHKSVAVTSMQDIRLETTSTSKLRFATYIVLEPQSDKPIHMLSVHLKAGCRSGYRESKNCRRLKGQVKQLRQWVVERELDNDAYVILGDFNHNLSYPNDWAWTLLAEKTNTVLTSKETEASCEVQSRKQHDEIHKYPSVIDHIVLSKGLSFSAAKQQLYNKEDVLNYELSDHCLVVFELH